MRRVLVVTLIFVAVFSMSQSILLDDVDVAVNLARIEQKKIGLIFTTATCPYCVKLKNETLKDKTVQELIKANFVFVEVMYDSAKKVSTFGRQMTHQELFSHFSISGVPTTWFLSSDAKPLVYLPGYAPASIFAQILRYVYQEIKEDFQTYSKKKDDFVGEKKIVYASEEEAAYVLKHDLNSSFVEQLPEKIDVFKVYVVRNQALAQKLSDFGVFRVILIK